ncbi:hypothetical protein Bca52824_069794 [Brassica carinata]|uniref:Uncharacterized protein n=1 Tax=Brassica carinata TaxID=52824 RepID=A0A8X7Q384_BRACI|nr:hypothetical protein Bca52824_069794 [Brassica carinata]
MACRGYEVTTVVDGHKSGLNPHTLESFLRTTTSSTLEKYCHCVVNRLIQLNLEAHMFTVFHHSRFNDEFGCEEESDDGSLQNLVIGKPYLVKGTMMIPLC